MSSDEILNEILKRTEPIAEMLRRMGLIETGVQNLGTRLETLESEVSSLIVEHIQDLAQKLETQINSLRSDMEKGFRQIQRQFDQVAGEQTRLRAAIDDLEERHNKLEKQPA